MKRFGLNMFQPPNNHIKSPSGLGRCASRRAPYVNRYVSVGALFS